MKKILITTAAFVLCALLVTTAASAEPVNWTISTPFTSNGDSITGSFTFDADTGVASNEALTATAPFGSASCATNSPISATSLGCTIGSTLYLSLASPLTDAGGTVDQSGGSGVLTSVTPVAPAPEPQSYALGLLGMAALGTARAYASRKASNQRANADGART